MFSRRKCRRIFILLVTVFLCGIGMIVVKNLKQNVGYLRNLRDEKSKRDFHQPPFREMTFAELLMEKLYRNKNSSKTSGNNCEIESMEDGLPWSACAPKMTWLKSRWRSDPCYAAHGVNDTVCSWYDYLARVEGHCPQKGNVEPKRALKSQYARRKTSLTELGLQFGKDEDFAFIKERLLLREQNWIQAAEVVLQSQSTIKAKNILVHLGLLKIGIGKNARKGGPLGELVQWSDVIASLYVIGHHVTICKSISSLKVILSSVIATKKDNCETHAILPFDLIYTDIFGFKDLKAALGGHFDVIKCRLRIVDSFGTEAVFNNKKYGISKKYKASRWGGLDLDLRQFNTMYPHTPDNTFLGFVIENPTIEKAPTIAPPSVGPCALVYGKRGIFWKGKSAYIDQIHKHFPDIHATVSGELNFVPTYVINHGVVSINKILELYRKCKVFVGLGFPFEGPAPLEAIANGAIYINPLLDPTNLTFYNDKPTTRRIVSQNPYAGDFIGPPRVYTVDINNSTQLDDVLRQVAGAGRPRSYLPTEFKFAGMIERLSIQVEKQNFCTSQTFFQTQYSKVSEFWPPVTASIPEVAAPSTDCTETCKNRGLICEPSFFQLLNRNESFAILGIQCSKLTVVAENNAEVDFPAFDKETRECFLQVDRTLFSCAGAFTHLTRLCPCRDFAPEQTALCKDCRL